MPSLRSESWIHEDDHANNGLHIVRDAGAGDDPPPNDAECSDRERRNVLVLLWCEDICEMILPWCSRSLVSRSLETNLHEMGQSREAVTSREERDATSRTTRGGKSRSLFRQAEGDQPLDETSHYQSKDRCLRSTVEHALTKATGVGKPGVGDTGEPMLFY